MVQVAFKNIQSHAYTEFKFVDGMNFIVSADNNVGKSTIFSVLNTIARMPDVSNTEFKDLLRNGESTGYAVFDFGVEQVILWLMRDKEMVNGFIEHRQNGGTIRTVLPPKVFFEKMGIKVAKSGGPINIVDANNVQLFVDSGRSTDSIIEDVLVDSDIERVKENLAILYKRAARDVRDLNVREEYCNQMLATVTYNEYVDAFETEVGDLEKLAQVVDYWGEGVKTEVFGRSDIEKELISELGLLKSAINVIESVECMLNRWEEMECSETLQELEGDRVFSAAMGAVEAIDTGYKSVLQLSSENNKVGVARLAKWPVLRDLEGKHLKTERIIKNIGLAVDGLSGVMAAKFAVDKVAEFGWKLEKDRKEYARLREILLASGQIVECPVKGRVIYGECVPISD